MRARSISDIRTLETMVYDSERRLRRGLLSLSEYSEITDDLRPLKERETVETISQKVADFFKLYGVHIESKGIGYSLTWY